MGKRKKLTKDLKEKGLPSTTRFLTSYEVGQRVAIKIDPSIHKGRPHHRFHGKTGKIIKKQGSAYIVRVRDEKRMKKVIVRPEHLRSLGD